jgi:hypothetical protein
MNQRERAELDRHITGNYGEDQFANEEAPALWRREAHNIWRGEYHVAKLALYARTGYTASVYDFGDELVRKANAHDDLLAALEELVNARKAGNIAEEHWDNARAAIAKAKP